MDKSRVREFKSPADRRLYLEGVALGYLAAVVEGSIPFTEDRFRCATVMLGYLQHGKDTPELPHMEKARRTEDTALLLDKEVAGATSDGPQTGQ